MRKVEVEYVRIFNALPDLLALAIEQSAADRYKVQDELRETYRSDGLPFRWSMPLRSFGVCHRCSEQFTQVVYVLENPRLETSCNTSSSHMHAVEKHDAQLDAEIKAFLDGAA